MMRKYLNQRITNVIIMYAPDSHILVIPEYLSQTEVKYFHHDISLRENGRTSCLQNMPIKPNTSW